MPEYRVTWEIDVEADTPAEAAEKARRYAVKEDTTATRFDVYGRIAESGGIDDGPIFERVAEFDVRSNPSFPHFKALTIEEADAQDEAEIAAEDALSDLDDEGDAAEDGNPRCTSPTGHDWGTADKDNGGDGRTYCQWCLADGDG